MNDILSDLIKIKREMVPAFDIQVTDHMPTRTVQARRHKRKSSRRWQKKWLKRFGTKEIHDSDIYQIGNTLVMSKATEARLRESLRQRVRDFYDRQAFTLLSPNTL